jgi:tetratricopeptide (TPR) repeat protein
VGLISKAINKVEKNASPAAGQKTTSEPRRKKKLLIAASALLVIGICLVAGYLFLLRPTAEIPPRVPRRSISAKARPPKPAPKHADQKKVAEASGEGVAGKDSPSPETSEAAPSQKETGKETVPVEAKDSKPSTPEETSLVRLVEEQTSEEEEVPESMESSAGMPQEEPDQEAEIVKSPVDQLLKPEESPAMDEGQSIPAEAPQSEDTKMAPGDLPDERSSAISEQNPWEEIYPSYLEEMDREWTQRQLAVDQKSASRARRYYRKGVSYHRQGKLDGAIDSYREALIFDPDHLPTHINLSTAYLQTGRFKEAEQELVYLYALRPRDSKILFNFGLLLYRIGEHVSAEIKLKRLLDLDPFQLEAGLLLASIYEEKGDIGQALELCMRAHQINSADSRVLYRLGRAWDMAGEPAKAVKYYQLFLKTRSPKDDKHQQAVRDRLAYLINGKE